MITASFNKVTALLKDGMKHNMPYNEQLHLLNTVAYTVYMVFCLDYHSKY